MGNKVVQIVTDESPAIQMLQFSDRHKDKFANRSTWANTSGTEIRKDDMGFPMTDESGKEITVRRKEWGHEMFRNAMQYALIRIPYHFYMWLAESDEKLIHELSGTIERRRPSGYMEFIAPSKTPGSTSPDDHNTDSVRHAALAIFEALGVDEIHDPAWDEYAAAIGWAGEGGDWQSPWDDISLHPSPVPHPRFPV
jgi:hypothetical protein